ncbi:MAG TPA: metabolite traffic protein EboE [Verrucomicrobiae bacterium]|nr:metabolite traffic protein EboE [Verrucomicrobiae bacterium]
MTLKHGLHLAYCTNVHRGESWAETFSALEHHTLRVKDRVQPNGRYAIGLRLSDQASRELSDSQALLKFQRWLDEHDCYVFTINGFPFGQFHGTRVKENVYRPDWTDPRRLEYTNRLFDILAQLVPLGIEGSVSTLPGSFKDFITSPEQERAMRDNFWRCVEHISALSEKANRQLHLGVEPEPFGWFENTAETLRFFEQMHDEHPDEARLESHLGVNYDACHFAIEFEDPAESVMKFQERGIRLSKIHLSNALKLRPSATSLKELAAFAEDVYLHQVIARAEDGTLTRFRDLPAALECARLRAQQASSGADRFARAAVPEDGHTPESASEWRVHFHVPLHWQPTSGLNTTSDHVQGLLKLLELHPHLCSHLEMETYTWAVLPEPWRSRDVVDQLVGEYAWTLRQLGAHGLR